MSKLKLQIDKLRNQFTNKIQNLTSREKLLAVAAAIFLLSILVNKIYTPTSQAFTRQSEELRKAEIYLTELPNLIGRFHQLESKRQQIETAYQNVEIAEGLSHIEAIIKDKAELTSTQDYQIKERALNQKDFGGNYEQKSYTVELKLRSYKTLAALLKELTTGRKPMILSNLDISKSPSGEILSVIMELSTIQKKQSIEANAS